MKSTIMISMSQVPLYLQKGAFYLNLDPSDEEMFEVPSNCLKPDRSIQSVDDLTHLFHSVRFWGVREMLFVDVDFIFRNVKKAHLKGLMGEFPDCRGFLDKMHILIASKPSQVVVNFINHGADKGDIVYLHEKMGFELCPDCWQAAILQDDVESVAYLLKKKAPSHKPWTLIAAATGSIKCLRYAHMAGMPIGNNSLVVAARHGHHEVVHYLHEVVNMPLPDSAMKLAAPSGNLILMRYLHSKGCPWNVTVCELLALKDRLECLQFAHENGCPWDESTCHGAAHSGSLRCLKYAHEQGCPWDGQTTVNARDMAHRNCLNYAVEHGCYDPDAGEEDIIIKFTLTLYTILAPIVWYISERPSGFFPRRFSELTLELSHQRCCQVVYLFCGGTLAFTNIVIACYIVLFVTRWSNLSPVTLIRRYPMFLVVKAIFWFLAGYCVKFV